VSQFPGGGFQYLENYYSFHFQGDLPSSLLELDLDVKPLHLDVDLAIKVKTQPLLINFSDRVVSRLLDFLKTVSRKNEVIVAELSASTTQRFSEVQKKVWSPFGYRLTSVSLKPK
jgi:hypothetical protein